MAGNVKQPADSLTGCLLETFLYAIYILLFGAALRVQRRREPPPREDRWARRTVRAISSITLLLFACITTHWCLQLYRTVYGIVYAGDTRQQMLRYLIDLSAPTYNAQNGVYAASRIMMDGLLVFRLYVVWEHQYKVIAFPAFLVLGDLVSSIMLEYWGLQYEGPTSQSYYTQRKWIIAAYSFSCSTNVIATSLIAWRIIQRNRILAPWALRTSLMPVIVVVVESAVAYTTMNITVFSLFLTNNYFPLGVLFPAVNPLMGIVYSLIMIQTTLGFTRLRRASTTLPTLHALSFAPNPDLPPNRSEVTEGTTDIEVLDDAGADGDGASACKLGRGGSGGSLPSFGSGDADVLALEEAPRRKAAHARSYSSMV